MQVWSDCRNCGLGLGLKERLLQTSCLQQGVEGQSAHGILSVVCIHAWECVMQN